MKKVLLMILGLAVLLFVLVTCLIKAAQDEVKTYKQKVGHRYVLERDTILIVNYSTLKDTYITYQGREIAPELLQTLTEVK